MSYFHKPVMLNEILEEVDLKEGDKAIDCTLGGGGYTKALSELVGETGKILAIDLDELAHENFKKQEKDLKYKNIVLVHDNFRNLKEIIKEKLGEGEKFKAIVMDLGLSSAQLEDRERGFSFKEDRPLNMSFSKEEEGTWKIVNKYPQEKLKEIFKILGEEKFAGPIAKNIVIARKIEKIDSTQKLKEIIDKSVPKKSFFQNISPYTKVFQSLRMETNKELESLKKVLPQALDSLEENGKIFAVSFHSGEDRIVKNFFKQEATECLCPKEIPVCRCDHKKELEIITKKPLIPSKEEIEENPRARSAKLRIAKKI